MIHNIGKAPLKLRDDFGKTESGSINLAVKQRLIADY